MNEPSPVQVDSSTLEAFERAARFLTARYGDSPSPEELAGIVLSTIQPHEAVVLFERLVLAVHGKTLEDEDSRLATVCSEIEQLYPPRSSQRHTATGSKS